MTNEQWKWYAPGTTEVSRKEEMASLITNEKYGSRSKTFTRKELIILCNVLKSFANGNVITDTPLSQNEVLLIEHGIRNLFLGV